MDGATVLDLFRQIESGEDIPKISNLLKKMTVEQACAKGEDWPYSILTNLAHADFWQQIWLARILGEPRPKFKDDWRIPAPEEFHAIRKSFLSGLDTALKIVTEWPIEHKMKSDDAALHTLMSIAIHDAYHIGQIKLMARLVPQAKE